MTARTPTPPLKGRGLSSRATSARTNSLPLQGRSRGWGLSASAIDELQSGARQMRNNPPEPERGLWAHLSNGQLHGFKFRRQQVIGHHIADFVCPSAKLIVEVDGDTHEDAADRARDDALALFGYRTVRFSNPDVMTNVEGVLLTIADALHSAARPHPRPSPEGKGLEEAGF